MRAARALGYADLARHGLRLRTSKDEAVRRNARRHLATRMGRLRGLPQKLGQMLSMSAEPEDDAFTHLGDGAEPLPVAAIRAELERAWGRPLEAVVACFEEQGRAASLGQVHRARLHDGREVAIKVRYPGISDAVRTDLRCLGWLSAPVGDLRRGFDLRSYQDELRRDLEHELDYTREAAAQVAYAEAFAGLPVVVPEVVRELSCERVLVTTWEDGDELDAAARWPLADRRAAARVLLQTFCHGLFSARLLHADPHPGNLRLRRAAGGVSLVLYDYGSVLRLPPQRSLILLRLLRGDPDDDPLRLLVGLGFDADLLDPLRGRLPAIVSVLNEPFRRPYRFDVGAWSVRERLSDVLGDDRWNFRMAGPAHLLFFVRAWQGLLHQLRALGAPVCFSRFLRPHLAERRAALAALNLPHVQGATFGSLARHLCIHVSEHGATKARLTLPAECIDTLQEELGQDLARRIQSGGVDLSERVRAVRASGYAPQEVFEDEQGARHVRVWLE